VREAMQQALSGDDINQEAIDLLLESDIESEEDFSGFSEPESDD
jgi:hypothetical protein